MRGLPKENIYGHTKKLKFILRHLNDYMNSHCTPVSVLDFGCGNGTAVSQFLIREGVRYYGVDTHEPSLSYARKHFQRENATFLDHVPEGILFDVIVYADILEHLENPVTVLQQHAEKLKEEGMIIGSVPNGLGPFENEKRIDKWLRVSSGIRLAASMKGKLINRGAFCDRTLPYNSDSGHVQFFSRRSLYLTLRQEGFETECFEKGAFLGGPLSERILRGGWIERANSSIGDVLPYWAVSTWYFTAKRKTRTDVEKIHVHDLRRMFHLKKWRSARRLDIECENVNTVAKRELFELWLYVCGVKDWQWVDGRGHISKRGCCTEVLGNLFRDMLKWPFLYRSTRNSVMELSKTAPFRGVLKSRPSAVFLRTDHWFNVKSGGSVAHVNGIVHGLRALGYDTRVVSTDRLAGIEEDEHFYCCEPLYRVGRNLPNLPETLYNDDLLKFLDRYWEKWNPSFVYQRYSLANYTGVLCKQRHGVPYVCEYNGSFVWMTRHWGERRLFHEKLMNRIELLNLESADLVVVVSRPLKEELVSRGIDADKVLVNPNGVDPDRYSPNVEGSGVRKQYNLNGKIVIGFIGTFGKWHGAEVLAKAFGLLLQNFPGYREKVRLLMIGDGVTMPWVKENLRDLGAIEYAILAGLVPQERGPEYLAACDILTASHQPNPDGTPFFGSPTKLFEYMAMGKGIVASDLDQIGEILKHDDTAWMVRPGDAVSLEKGLKVLIDDEGRRHRLGESARREAVAKYTWENHTRRIIEELKERCG